MKNISSLLLCALALFTSRASAQITPSSAALAPIAVTAVYYDPASGLPAPGARLDATSAVAEIRAAAELSWIDVLNPFRSAPRAVAAQYTAAAKETLLQAAKQLSWPVANFAPAATWHNYYLAALRVEEDAARESDSESDQATHEGRVTAYYLVVRTILAHGGSWVPPAPPQEPTVGHGVPCSRAFSLLEVAESAARTGVTQCPFAAADAWKAWLSGAAQIYRDLQGQVLAVLYGQAETVTPLADLLEQLAAARFESAWLPTEVERARAAGRALAVQTAIEVIYGQVFIPEPSNSEPERSSDPLLPQLAKPEIQPGVISLN